MLVKQETKPETKQNLVKGHHQFVRMRIAFFCGAHAVSHGGSGVWGICWNLVSGEYIRWNT